MLVAIAIIEINIHALIESDLNKFSNEFPKTYNHNYYVRTFISTF